MPGASAFTAPPHAVAGTKQQYHSHRRSRAMPSSVAPRRLLGMSASPGTFTEYLSQPMKALNSVQGSRTSTFKKISANVCDRPPFQEGTTTGLQTQPKCNPGRRCVIPYGIYLHVLCEDCN